MKLIRKTYDSQFLVLFSVTARNSSWNLQTISPFRVTMGHF